MEVDALDNDMIFDNVGSRVHHVGILIPIFFKYSILISQM